QPELPALAGRLCHEPGHLRPGRVEHLELLAIHVERDRGRRERQRGPKRLEWKHPPDDEAGADLAGTTVRSAMSPRHRFTLLVLVVTAAILGILAGLALAAVQRVRFAAARMECQSRLRQAGLAVLGYESAHGRLPPGSVQGPCEPFAAADGVSYGLWPIL